MGYDSGMLDIALHGDHSFQERFSKLRTLGVGAAGSVLLVKDKERDDDVVALKILKNDLAIDEHTLKRFNEEARLCQEIGHPNIIRAYDLVRFQDHIAYTMEFVEGCDLGDLYRDIEMTPVFIDHIFDQLLSALGALHERKIVHRDLKLENIIVQSDGTMKLGDLGLVKHLELNDLTRAGILLGTAQYMAPEYVLKQKFDERSDLYAAGIILLELLTGKRRLKSMDGEEALLHLTKTRFEIPEETLQEMPYKYQHIIRRSCEPEWELRYTSAEEMRKDFHLPEEHFEKLAKSRKRTRKIRLDSGKSKNRSKLFLKVVSGILLGTTLLLGTILFTQM